MVVSTSTTATTIVIFGSTGVQGGSVIVHLLTSPKEYRIRAVTRDVNKEKAKELTDVGIEVVQAEMGEEQAVKKAIEGCEIVFAVTNFWEHGATKELADGKRIMNASKEHGVKAVYWSGLPAVKEGSKGKYGHVQHFDIKADVTNYARSIGLHIVDVQPASYMENFLTLMAPKKQDDGSYLFAQACKPDSKLCMISCRKDYGAFVVGSIESGDASGPEVLACGDELTFADIAKVWAQGTRQKAGFVQVPTEVFRAKAGDEFTDMLSWFDEFGYYGGKDLAPSKKVLSGRVQTWAEFVKTSDWSKVIG